MIIMVFLFSFHIITYHLKLLLAASFKISDVHAYLNSLFYTKPQNITFLNQVHSLGLVSYGGKSLGQVLQNLAPLAIHGLMSSHRYHRSSFNTKLDQEEMY